MNKKITILCLSAALLASPIASFAETEDRESKRAEKRIKSLNGFFPGEYGEDSWAGVLLRDCIIGDNQKTIVMPFLANQYGEEKTPYTTYTIEEWNKMFP